MLGKRQTRGPGDDISDIEHLLDDQPISKFALRVHVGLVLTVFVCTF